MKSVIRKILRSVWPNGRGRVRCQDLRGMARKYGRGNIRIQQGRIMSAAEYERRRESVLAYGF